MTNPTAPKLPRDTERAKGQTADDREREQGQARAKPEQGRKPVRTRLGQVTDTLSAIGRGDGTDRLSVKGADDGRAT